MQTCDFIVHKLVLTFYQKEYSSDQGSVLFFSCTGLVYYFNGSFTENMVNISPRVTVLEQHSSISKKQQFASQTIFTNTSTIISA